ncbi:MAG: type VI secretion system tip protein TssI/VgrG, partial [Polyangiaceae bacterium]
MTLSKLELRFHCEGASTTLDPRRLDGVEEVGRPTRLDLEVFASAPLDDVVGLVGAPCALSVASPLGSRVIHGVVLAITQKASALGDGARLYRVEMASALAVLGLRRDHRVFQKLTGPDLVSQLLDEGGARPAGRELSGEHPAIRYVTQYAETNLDFLRRLCEEDGLWYRFEPRDGFDEVVLGDDVEGAPESSLGEPLLLTEEAGLGADVPRAWQVEVGRARAVGAVTMSGYAFRNPAAAVTGDAELGSDVELPSRCYRVAPRATTAAEATRAAQIAVEAARAESRRVRFTTSAFVLQPGRRFELEPDVGYTGPVPERSLFVTSVEHRYDGSLYTCQVEAVPRSQPYRLPQKTPRPHIAGVQTAIVTGPPGEEIFTDEDGCVRVRFHWDRFGPTDQESSLPVRVLHPNLAGSMLIPRIGWEVWVAFEDGDPDRPFVIGRAYNGKHGPPVALPVNKTMTMLSTSSSPGAGAVNSVSFEDAAGRQGMNWNAGLGLTQTVGNDASIQTVADEKVKVDGSVAISVGGNQKEAVIQGRTVSTPAQLIRVGGSQKLKTPAASTVQTGSEDIVCSVLMEQVGSPGGALGALGIQAGMTVGGMIPGVGLLLGAGKAAYDAYDAYQKDGV